MELLTADEVARMLKCSPEFVYKNRVLLGGVKIGRLVRFQMTKIEEVMGIGGETRDDLEIRLRKTSGKVQERRISDQAGSDRSGSQSPNRSKEDKYGLLKALQLKAGRTGNSEE
jgi:hypothetical protein